MILTVYGISGEGVVYFEDNSSSMISDLSEPMLESKMRIKTMPKAKRNR